MFPVEAGVKYFRQQGIEGGGGQGEGEDADEKLSVHISSWLMV